MGHKEEWTFTRDEIDDAKKKHLERTGEKWTTEQLLKEWAVGNGCQDYEIDARQRKVTEYWDE